jgi:hypothetical protein
VLHKLREDVALLKSKNALLKYKIKKYVKKLVNLRDRSPIDLIYGQTRKSLSHQKQPHFGIQPEVMPQLQFLDMCILLHLRKNLLTEELLCTLHQLFLLPMFLASK